MRVDQSSQQEQRCSMSDSLAVPWRDEPLSLAKKLGVSVQRRDDTFNNGLVKNDFHLLHGSLLIVLLKLLESPPFHLLHNILAMDGNERIPEEAGESLAMIITTSGRMWEIAAELIDCAVHHTTASPYELLRGNSPQVFMLVQLANSLGRQFLRRMLKPCISLICNMEEEIDFNVEEEEEQELEIQKLSTVCSTCFEYVWASKEQCPRSLVGLCYLVYDCVSVRFPAFGQQSISALMMLRFLCPGLMVPQRAGIADPLSPSQRQILVIISKIFQALASNVEFGDKDRFLTGMNRFLRKKGAKMYDFLKFLRSPIPIPVSSGGVTMLDVRDIGRFYTFVQGHLSEITDTYIDNDSMKEAIMLEAIMTNAQPDISTPRVPRSTSTPVMSDITTTLATDECNTDGLIDDGTDTDEAPHEPTYAAKRSSSDCTMGSQVKEKWSSPTLNQDILNEILRLEEIDVEEEESSQAVAPGLMMQWKKNDLEAATRGQQAAKKKKKSALSSSGNKHRKRSKSTKSNTSTSTSSKPKKSRSFNLLKKH